MKCDICQEEIDDNALKCHLCHEWTKAGRFSFKNLSFLSTCILSLALALLLTGSVFFRTINKQNSLIFLEAGSDDLSLNYEDNRSEDIVIIGEINNKSAYRYRSLDIVVTYFDKENKRVDVIRAYVPSISPNGKEPFKVKIEEKDIDNIQNYDHFTVEINNAYRYRN